MMTLIREGGWPMWLVLVFGATSLIASGLFTWRPERRKLGFIFGVSAATLLTTVMAVFADLAAVGHHMNERWGNYYAEDAGYQGVVQALCQGFAESMSPGVMGFSFLSLAALLLAAGAARLEPAGAR